MGSDSAIGEAEAGDVGIRVKRVGSDGDGISCGTVANDSGTSQRQELVGVGGSSCLRCLAASRQAFSSSISSRFSSESNWNVDGVRMVLGVGVWVG